MENGLIRLVFLCVKLKMELYDCEYITSGQACEAFKGKLRLISTFRDFGIGVF